MKTETVRPRVEVYSEYTNAKVGFHGPPRSFTFENRYTTVLHLINAVDAYYRYHSYRASNHIEVFYDGARISQNSEFYRDIDSGKWFLVPMAMHGGKHIKCEPIEVIVPIEIYMF